MQLNIQGLRNKNAILESFLDGCHNRFLAVCICEHWLTTDEIADYSVAKYGLGASFCRSNHIRGGVMILVRNDVRCTPISLDDFSADIDGEVAGVKILEQNLKS